MRIRLYNNPDYKEVLRMLSESMDYHMKIADPSVFVKSSDKLMSNYLRYMVAKAKSPSAILLVSEDDKKELTGFVYGETPKYSPERTKIGKKCGVVHEIYVSPSARKQGLGKDLMKAIEDFFIKNKCELVLLNDVHHKNTPAVNLYEKLGYHVRVSEYVKKL